MLDVDVCYTSLSNTFTEKTSLVCAIYILFRQLSFEKNKLCFQSVFTALTKESSIFNHTQLDLQLSATLFQRDENIFLFAAYLCKQKSSTLHQSTV